MFGRNRNNRMNDFQRQERAPARGPGRHHDLESPDLNYGRPLNDQNNERRGQTSYSEYSGFEGTNDRPYYGGEEGRFPFGGAPGEFRSSSYNADERHDSNQWMSGSHVGKGPKGYRRSDDRIREEVCEILTRHGDIDASEIEVQVQDGIVQLTGTVESRQVKRLAEDLIERINGVEDIRNELRIFKPGIAPEWPAGTTGSLNSNKSSHPVSDRSPQGGRKMNS